MLIHDLGRENDLDGVTSIKNHVILLDQEYIFWSLALYWQALAERRTEIVE